MRYCYMDVDIDLTSMCRRVCDVMIEKLPNLHHQQCRHLTLGVIVIIVIIIIIIATAVVTATAAAVTVAPVVTAVATAPFTARAVVVVVVAVRIEIEVTPAVQYVADASRVRQRIAVGCCSARRVYTCDRWQNHSTDFFPTKHSTLN